MKAENLLLEIGCEELPASSITSALKFLKEQLKNKLENASIPPSTIETFGTPRRLIAVVYDIPESQPDREDIIVGPSIRAAFDAKGNPTKAAVGFARSKGVALKDLVRVVDIPGKNGEYIAIKRVVKGKDTVEILSEILPDIILSVPFKRSMRWGTTKVRFGRPIRWITAVYGEITVDFEVDGIKSSNISYGHRFLSPEGFTVKNVNEFISDLEERFVIADIENRKAIILDVSRTLAKNVGGKLLEDEELLNEVTNLVEYPYPILGNFDKRFLKLPKEVPIVVMKEHQRFFSVVDENENLKNYFIGVSNVKPLNENTIRSGYEKVLKARLSDALFFFNEDRKVKLSDRVPKLKGIVFHEKLGTMLDKTKRLEKLAPLISEKLNGLKEKAKRAAYLSKVDLLTEMVNEFPELQGIMGKYYALYDGEDGEVASAIEEHYLPRFAGDRVAKGKIGIPLSIAEKVDNLVGFFGVGIKPTGSADPFSLRRNAIGLIQTLLENKIHLNLLPLLESAVKIYTDSGIEISQNTPIEVLNFVKERFKILLRGKEFRADTIDAVLSVTDDILDAYLRIRAIEALRESQKFEDVLITMRRVANIIPEGFKTVQFEPKGTYEVELYKRFVAMRKSISTLISSRNYEGALSLIKELKPYVDAFFDNVMVMDKDEVVRNRRLSLLKTIADELRKIADFSKIRF